MSHSDRPDPENVYLYSGQLAATPDEVFLALDALDIDHNTIEHPPLYTVEEARAMKYGLEGAHTKNLFLRNKKGRMFLLVLPSDLRVDLKALRDQLKLTGGQLAFASTERLGKYLGVVPGSVSPLAAINDHSGKVTIYIEQSLLDHSLIYLHPCRNTHSTCLKTTDLLRVLEAWDHSPQVIKLA
jgi:Ala-tRNA(Pro) deacylase